MAEKFEKQFTCLGENTKKYITFTVSIGKEVTTTDKNGEEFTKNISFRSRFVDTARFMANSLPNLVKNFAQGIHRIKAEHVKLNSKIASAFLNTQTLKII